MIVPTIGRQVLFWKHGNNERGKANAIQPEAATICYVHHNECVNLQVLSHTGVARQELSVMLAQDDKTYEWSCCEWMAYQKQVASGAIEPALHASAR